MCYKKVEVNEPWLTAYELNGIKMETNMKFNKPTVNSKYIKILALCLVYAPAKLIYPNTEHPLMHEVRDMCRQGLLNRYTKKGDRKYYYKTTNKGTDLLIKVVSEEFGNGTL